MRMRRKEDYVLQREKIIYTVVKTAFSNAEKR
jgi:hypothetical protein